MRVVTILELLIIGTLLLGPAEPMQAAPPGEAFTYKVVGGRELKIYVTKPSDWRQSDSRPAIVFFHGGGWVGGQPGQFTEHAQHFASRGLVCFQVEYRLLDRKLLEPPIVCTQDAKSAMRWVRGRSERFGIDPNRIASAGGSAGGHLAAFVGTVDGGDDPQDDLEISAKSNAMLLFNPVYDNGPKGWGSERVRGRYPEFSPLHNLTPDDPPSIVFLGTKDRLIPVATAKKFKTLAESVGVDSELHLYEDQEHGFFNVGRDDGRWFRETIIAADQFLTQLGWLKTPPT